MAKPKPTSSLAEQELNKVEQQFQAYDDQIKSLTLDRMNQTPKQESEPQTKLSQQEIANSKDIYLKPYKTISCRDKFNEAFREAWNFAKEYVYFTAENKEIIGEAIDLWTKPFAGIPAEEWKIPVNTPIWAPRYVAEQLKSCHYHRLAMDQSRGVGADGAGQYFGHMVIDTTVQRLDALPVSKRRSVFMGASSF